MKSFVGLLVISYLFTRKDAAVDAAAYAAADATNAAVRTVDMDRRLLALAGKIATFMRGYASVDSNALVVIRCDSSSL